MVQWYQLVLPLWGVQTCSLVRESRSPMPLDPPEREYECLIRELEEEKN